jgi:hypothetical protein
VFPIEHKLARIEARGTMSLPLSVYRHRTNHFNPKASLAVNSHPSAHIACIDAHALLVTDQPETAPPECFPSSPHPGWRAGVVATWVIR